MADADDRSEIAPAYASAFPSGDLLAYLESCDGCIVRSAHGWRTFRFTENGRAYFAKVHTGVRWGEIIKNLTMLRLPVVSAANEWRASQRIASLGVRVPTPVAYGVRGRSPARLRSYLITEALDDTLTLEQVAQHWRAHPPPARLKHAVIDEVARIARTLHENGINHRDFYLCHFRIAEQAVRDPDRADCAGLILMDLHRVQMRLRVPRRWREKDLAGLLFSAMDAPISQRDVLRFAKRYRDAALRDTFVRDARLWRHVRNKALRLYRSIHNREPHTAILHDGQVRP